MTDSKNYILVYFEMDNTFCIVEDRAKKLINQKEAMIEFPTGWFLGEIRYRGTQKKCEEKAKGIENGKIVFKQGNTLEGNLKRVNDYLISRPSQEVEEITNQLNSQNYYTLQPYPPAFNNTHQNHLPQYTMSPRHPQQPRPSQHNMSPQHPQQPRPSQHNMSPQHPQQPEVSQLSPNPHLCVNNSEISLELKQLSMQLRILSNDVTKMLKMCEEKFNKQKNNPLPWPDTIDYKGTNLLGIHATSWNKYITKLMDLLFTVEERKNGLLLGDKPSKSNRRPLSPDRVRLLKSCAVVKAKAQPDQIEKVWADADMNLMMNEYVLEDEFRINNYEHNRHRYFSTIDDSHTITACVKYLKNV
ncbi:unnamed protein product [Brachionus calyciflorus]|uniref:BEN domain-containing protein n=1 Tax=Brachionus calyciflorus TaxID=104777 RepID=A0A813Y116_9BILA|nr:unnamed protein product [Brachionus calyciflorus]